MGALQSKVNPDRGDFTNLGADRRLVDRLGMDQPVQHTLFRIVLFRQLTSMKAVGVTPEK